MPCPYYVYSCCCDFRPSGTEDVVRVYAEADTQVSNGIKLLFALYSLLLHLLLQYCASFAVHLIQVDWLTLTPTRPPVFHASERCSPIQVATRTLSQVSSPLVPENAILAPIRYPYSGEQRYETRWKDAPGSGTISRVEKLRKIFPLPASNANFGPFSDRKCRKTY